MIQVITRDLAWFGAIFTVFLLASGLSNTPPKSLSRARIFDTLATIHDECVILSTR